MAGAIVATAKHFVQRMLRFWDTRPDGIAFAKGFDHDEQHARQTCVSEQSSQLLFCNIRCRLTSGLGQTFSTRAGV